MVSFHMLTVIGVTSDKLGNCYSSSLFALCCKHFFGPETLEREYLLTLSWIAILTFIKRSERIEEWRAGE